MPLDIPFEPIQWSDRMLTGVAEVDSQHRYLVATLKRATEQLMSGEEALPLGEVARELLNYAIMHFETEESLMKRYGYGERHPDLAKAHIAAHREFSHRVVAVCDQLREGRPVSKVDVLLYLNDWLRTHVLGIDQELGAFVRQATEQPGRVPTA